MLGLRSRGEDVGFVSDIADRRTRRSNENRGREKNPR